MKWRYILVFLLPICFVCNAYSQKYIVEDFNNERIKIDGIPIINKIGKNKLIVISESDEVELNKNDFIRVKKKGDKEPIILTFNKLRRALKRTNKFDRYSPKAALSIKDYRNLFSGNGGNRRLGLSDGVEENNYSYIFEDEVNHSFKETRTALIIGNSYYENENDFQDVPTCVESATIIAKKLRQLGFHTIVGYNNAKEELDFLIEAISQNESDTNNIKIVYYVGHGVKVGDNDYMVPIDGNKNDSSTWIRIRDVANRMESCNSKYNLLFVDACRDGSEKNDKVESSNNLNKTWIITSSRGGKTADAGKIITPFTDAFLCHIDAHNKDLGKVFTGISNFVRKEKKGLQLPEIIAPTLSEHQCLSDMYLNRISYNYIGVQLSYQFVSNQKGLNVHYGRQLKSGFMFELGIGAFLPTSDRIVIFDDKNAFSYTNSYEYFRFDIDVAVGYEIVLMNKWIQSIKPVLNISNAFIIGCYPLLENNSKGKYAEGVFFSPSLRFDRFVDNKKCWQLFGSVGVVWNPNKRYGDPNFQRLPNKVPFKEFSGIVEFGVNYKL